MSALLPWRNYLVDDEVGHKQMHLVPLHDLGQHKLCGKCACEPVEDAIAPDYWTHNAFDGREKHETGAKLH